MAGEERLAAQHAQAVRAVRSRVLAYVAAVWSRLGSYRDADADRFVAAVVPMVLAGQRQVAALTDAYLAGVIAAMLGGAPQVVGQPDITDAGLRTGVEPEVVYRRPFVEVWTLLSQGIALEFAVRRALGRAQNLAATDMQLAKTRAAHARLSGDDRVTGYRRVLQGPENCGLCVVASTQRYHRGSLMPIHPACDCGVMPIVGSRDPGQVINRGRLDAAHDAIEQRFGQSDAGARVPDYRKVLLIQEHGELGPVLAVSGQKFTGPDDI